MAFSSLLDMVVRGRKKRAHDKTKPGAKKKKEKLGKATTKSTRTNALT